MLYFSAMIKICSHFKCFNGLHALLFINLVMFQLYYLE